MYTIIILIFLVALYIALKKKKRGQRPPLAEGAWPIVGHTFTFLQNPVDLHKLMIKLSKEGLKREEACYTIRFGYMDIYAVGEPECAYRVLNSCMQKDIVYDYFKPWIGEGLITSSGDKWKRHRKLLNSSFNPEALDGYMSEVNKQARLLLNGLDTKVGTGRFDPAPFLNHTTLQTLCSTAMGVVADEKDKEMREEYIRTRYKFMSGLVKRAQSIWLHSEFIYNFSNLRTRQENHARTLHGLTNAVIKKRKTEIKEVNTEKQFRPFLDGLLDMEEDGLLTTTEVKEEVDTFTFGGTDTSSVALQIALLNIGSFPDVQRKIFEELEEVFNGSTRDVEKQDVVQLKYLEAVIKETLRMYPPVFVVARTLDRDVKTRNYTLPSGSRCFISLYAVNRHPSWGPDADQFRPERWLDPASLPSCRFFASFSLGRRKCLGADFAMMALKIILSHSLRRYHVSGDISQLEQTLDVVTHPVSKDYISIQRRDNGLLGL